MGSVTLPFIASENDPSIEKKIISSDQTLVPSIQLALPYANDVSNVVTTLNDMNQVKRLKNLDERKKIMKLHGISVSSKTSPSFIREYILFIFQTEVLMIYRSKRQSVWLAQSKKPASLTYQRVPLDNKGKEVKKIQQLAIRALYAIGLDYGVIKCGVMSGNQMVVANINPTPRMNKEMIKIFERSVTNYMETISQKQHDSQIILGADPEFIVRSPAGQLVIASKYLPFHGKVGCDAIWIGKNRTHKPLVEIRPAPSSNPRKLVLRIYEHLIYVAQKMNAVSGKWQAGALPHHQFPLGGHIHFTGVKLNFKILRALDNYLTLPLMLAEDRRGIDRRPKYGYLGDYREKNHGGFEYRTPPSWIISPTLTKGILALAKCIAANYKKLSHDPLAEDEVQDAYYHGDKYLIKEWLNYLWTDIQSVDEYTQYHHYLDRFYRYISSGRTWNENSDFRRYWQIPPFHKRS